MPSDTDTRCRQRRHACRGGEPPRRLAAMRQSNVLEGSRPSTRGIRSRAGPRPQRAGRVTMRPCCSLTQQLAHVVLTVMCSSHLGACRQPRCPPSRCAAGQHRCLCSAAARRAWAQTRAQPRGRQCGPPAGCPPMTLSASPPRLAPTAPPPRRPPSQPTSAAVGRLRTASAAANRSAEAPVLRPGRPQPRRAPPPQARPASPRRTTPFTAPRDGDPRHRARAQRRGQAGAITNSVRSRVA